MNTKTSVKNSEKQSAYWTPHYEPMTNFLPSKKHKKKKHKKSAPDIALTKVKKSKKSHKKIFWIIIIMALILAMYINWGSISPYLAFPESIEESSIDPQVIEAFGYINKFRAMSGSPDLIYEEELYEWVKAVAETKQNNPDNYKTAAEFLKALEIDFDTSGITNSYYTTYFIGGKGLEEFLTQFNKNYNARNLIKDSKYNRGAIYCGLDYCVLFVFTDKNGLSPVVVEEEIKSTEKTSLMARLPELPELSLPSLNKVKVNPALVDNCLLCIMYQATGESCSFLEIMGESDGIGNIKEKACREACGEKNMEYYSDNCVTDKLECYCKE